MYNPICIKNFQFLREKKKNSLGISHLGTYFKDMVGGRGGRKGEKEGGWVGGGGEEREIP